MRDPAAPAQGSRAFLLRQTASWWVLGVLAIMAGESGAKAQSYQQTSVSCYISNCHSGVILTNGVLALGIEPAGVLSLEDANTGDTWAASSRNCGQALATGHSAAIGSSFVNLRYLPTNDDGEDCDLEGEGWGIGYVRPNFGPSAGDVQSYGASTTYYRGDLAPERRFASLSVDGLNPHQAAVSRMGGAVLVVQDFHPHPGIPNVYDDVIQLTNPGPGWLKDVRYRRAMSFGSSVHGSDGTYMTIATLPAGAPSPPALLHSNTIPLTFVSLNPWSPWPSGQSHAGPPDAPSLILHGPNDQGAGWDIGFADLPPRYTKTFTLFYGAASNHSEAMQTLAALDAQVYALATPLDHYESTTPTGTDPFGAVFPDLDAPAFFMAFGNLTKVLPMLQARFAPVMPSLCSDRDVSFHDTGSSVSWGSIIGRTYDFGDGSRQTGAIASHRFPRDDTVYNVTYTVTDSYGQNATAWQLVRAPTGDCPPILDPVSDQVVQLGNELAPLCLKAFDVDDTDLQLHWTLRGLPAGAHVDDLHCLHWRPSADQVSAWPLQVEVCDSHACSGQAFWIIVWSPVLPPGTPRCSDYDRDGVCDPADNCPGIPNYSQADDDGNGMGNACQMAGFASLAPPSGHAFGNPPDRDRDGVADTADNCPVVPNRSQTDLDGDSVGDACDSDLDGDGVLNASSPNGCIGFATLAPSALSTDLAQEPCDNCPARPNPDQKDRDADGIGDACDSGTWRPETATETLRASSASIHAPAPVLWGGIVLLAALASALAYVAGRRGFLAAIAFSRLTGLDPLRHATRARLNACIEETPGVRFESLVRASRLGRGTVEHHLRVLVAAGQIVRTVEGGYFPKDSPQRKPQRVGEIQAEERPTLTSRSRFVVAWARRNPGRSLSEIARGTGLPTQTISYQARRMAAAGIVRLERRQGKVLVFVVDNN